MAGPRWRLRVRALRIAHLEFIRLFQGIHYLGLSQVNAARAGTVQEATGCALEFIVISRDVVLLSTADWDNPFWTNKQHVAVELAGRGFRILYVDSLGLRRPTLKTYDRRRILRRLRRALQPPRRVRENLWVWSPLVLPAHGQTWVRRLNRTLLRIGMEIWLKWLRLRPDLIWTYNPLTTEVLSLSRFRTVVYHCVDEIKDWPGMPVQILERAEAELVRRANVVFTTAPRLAESRKRLNPNTHYLPNVADFEHFYKARHPDTRIPDDLSRIPEPRLGFIGAISGHKLDFGLLQRVADGHPEWSIVLIGAVGKGDPWTDVSELRNIPNLHLLGPRPYAMLPAYLKGFRVGLLPNRLNDYTASMFPMKFFEYLAAGLPVVSVDLPALHAYSDIALLTRTPTGFIEAIQQALCGGGPPLEVRIEEAKKHTYASRTDTMLDILGKLPE